MIHKILQFTRLIVFRYALHRCESQEIHYQEFILDLFVCFVSLLCLQKRIVTQKKGVSGSKSTHKQVVCLCLSCQNINKILFYYSKWSFRRFTYGNLVTTSPSSKAIDSFTFGFQIRWRTSFKDILLWTHRKLQSVGATGGVYRIQGRIQCTLMTCAYKAILVEDEKLQTSIPSTVYVQEISRSFQIRAWNLLNTPV